MDIDRTADFDLRHIEYVAKGYCTSVHWTKVWCAQRDGHAGDHWGLYLHPNNTFTVHPRWD